MTNPVTESFWDSIINLVKSSFGALLDVFPDKFTTVKQAEHFFMIEVEKTVNKAIPAIQVQAVEALMKFDMESEDQQWEYLEELFKDEKNFFHLRNAFEEYISTYALYVHELLPHQKTMLVKKCVELYPDIDRVDFNI